MADIARALLAGEVRRDRRLTQALQQHCRGQGVSSSRGRLLFGFTLDEWVAAGGADRKYFEVLLEFDQRPHERWSGAGEIDEQQWLRLARLGDTYAKRALAVIGPVWERWAAARRARIPELQDPDLQLDYLEWAQQHERALGELRELAGGTSRLTGE